MLSRFGKARFHTRPLQRISVSLRRLGREGLELPPLLV
jgi:hypothetical protein